MIAISFLVPKKHAAIPRSAQDLAVDLSAPTVLFVARTAVRGRAELGTGRRIATQPATAEVVKSIVIRASVGTMTAVMIVNALQTVTLHVLTDTAFGQESRAVWNARCHHPQSSVRRMSRPAPTVLLWEEILRAAAHSFHVQKLAVIQTSVRGSKAILSVMMASLAAKTVAHGPVELGMDRSSAKTSATYIRETAVQIVALLILQK